MTTNGFTPYSGFFMMPEVDVNMGGTGWNPSISASYGGQQVSTSVFGPTTISSGTQTLSTATGYTNYARANRVGNNTGNSPGEVADYDSGLGVRNAMTRIIADVSEEDAVIEQVAALLALMALKPWLHDALMKIITMMRTDPQILRIAREQRRPPMNVAMEFGMKYCVENDISLKEYLDSLIPNNAKVSQFIESSIDIGEPNVAILSLDGGTDWSKFMQYLWQELLYYSPQIAEAVCTYVIQWLRNKAADANTSITISHPSGWDPGDLPDQDVAFDLAKRAIVGYTAKRAQVGLSKVISKGMAGIQWSKLVI